MRIRLLRGDQRRRLLTVAGSVTAVAVAAGAMTLWAQARFDSLAGQSLVRIQVLEEERRTPVLGGGLSLPSLPTANLAGDASFEPLTFHKSLTVHDGTASILLVSASEAEAAVYGEGFFEGADIRVTTPGEQGLVLKKTARVLGYHVNRIGPVQPAPLPEELPGGLRVLDFAVHDGTAAASMGRGLVLLGPDTQSPRVADTGLEGDLVGLAGHGAGAGFLVVSSAGKAASSPDGLSWQAWLTPGPAELTAVAVSDDSLAVAVGRGGTVWAGRDGVFHAVSTGIGADLLDVAWGGGRFLAVGTDGTLLLSSNGTVWTPVAESGTQDPEAPEHDPPPPVYRTVLHSAGTFVVAGDGGRMALSTDGRTFRTVFLPNRPDLAGVVALSPRHLIALAADGSFLHTLDGGATFEAARLDAGVPVDRFLLTGTDRILLSTTEGGIGVSLLVTEIVLDSPLLDGTFRAGDRCQLELVAQDIPEGLLSTGGAESAGGTGSAIEAWDVGGTARAVRRMDESAPSGGIGCLSLSIPVPDTPGVLPVGYLSQVVARQGEDSPFLDGTLYQVEVWLRRTSPDPREILVWISGPFDPVGARFDNVGDAWRRYTFTFPATLPMAGRLDREVRLNFGVSGTVDLLVDRVFMGRSSDNAGTVPEAFARDLAAVSPGFLRLSFLDIGSSRTRTGSWAGAPGSDGTWLDGQVRVSRSGGSLETALAMTRSAGADPWLVIGPYADESDLRNLMEYLGGPISSEYGRLRMQNGSPMPWLDVFDRVLVEFVDGESVFGDDLMRSRQVTRMIRILEASPYFAAYKSRFAFVDGMAYEEGLMLSSADHHAGDLVLSIGADRPASLDAILEAFRERIPRMPDRPSGLPLELIRTSGPDPAAAQPTAAEWIEVLMRDMGLLTNAACVDIPWKEGEDDTELALGVAAILSSTAVGEPVPVLTTWAGDPEEEALPLGAHGFRTADRLVLVLACLGDQPILVEPDPAIPLRDAEFTRYAPDGGRTDTEILRRNTRFSLLPGWVCVLSIPRPQEAAP